MLTRSGPLLRELALPAHDAYDLPSSPKRFLDGGHVRVEIPSVEGPAAMVTVINEAAVQGLRVHRVSQGSGIWMLADGEIETMVALGAEADIEVSLFVGPRASWDTGRQTASSAGASIGASLRGADQLAYGTDEVIRACDLGLRSVLVADLGHLMVLGRLKRTGALPADLQLKVSALMPVANPATAVVMEQLGATSLNLPVDLPVPAIAAIRAAVDIPVDVYIEAADDFGGSVRQYDIPALARVACPIYLKFTVRNAPNTYPSGRHLEGMVQLLSAERVRRAKLGMDVLARYAPEILVSETSAVAAATADTVAPAR
jgi:hypothetical protein